MKNKEIVKFFTPPDAFFLFFRCAFGYVPERKRT